MWVALGPCYGVSLVESLFFAFGGPLSMTDPCQLASLSLTVELISSAHDD